MGASTRSDDSPDPQVPDLELRLIQAVTKRLPRIRGMGRLMWVVSRSICENPGHRSSRMCSVRRCYWSQVAGCTSLSSLGRNCWIAKRLAISEPSCDPKTASSTSGRTLASIHCWRHGA